MNDKFFNTIVKRANEDYLYSIQNTLNNLIGCVIERIIYTALYGDNYSYFRKYINPDIQKLISDIQALPDIVKYDLLTIYINMSHLSDINKSDLFLDISYSCLRNEDSSMTEYLRVEFPFMFSTTLLTFRCINDKTEAINQIIIRDIFVRILKICLCDNQEYHLGNNKNRLYKLINPDEIILIGEEEVKNIMFQDFAKSHINVNDPKLDLSKVLPPLLECLESNYDVFGLRVLNID